MMEIMKMAFNQVREYINGKMEIDMKEISKKICHKVSEKNISKMVDTMKENLRWEKSLMKKIS